MREIPVLMRPEMARATNLDMKVETRRLIGLETVNDKPDAWTLKEHCVDVVNRKIFVTFAHKKKRLVVDQGCPYGMIDDLLWIRESWNRDGMGGYRFVSDFPDHDSLLWKPSIHMHKAIARTWCQITEIRVERLHDITRDGAKDEGIDIFFDRFVYRIPTKYKGVMITTEDPVEAYLGYVNSINGLTMKDNPWVWVVRYQVLSTTGKPSMSQFHEDYMKKEVHHA